MKRARRAAGTKEIAVYQRESMRHILILGLIGAILLSPATALPFHPNASCTGVWSAGQIRRASRVHTTAILERFENGDFSALATSAQNRHAGAGDVLVATAWSFTPSPGTYRVRLETIVYDGLESAATSTQTLAAWPSAQMFRETATGSPFECGSTWPSFTSSPVTAASIGTTYEYGPLVSYVGAGFARFALLASPPAMSIDQLTGEITWSPSALDIGTRTIILMVEDSAAGSFDIQAYEIVVTSS